MPPLKVLQVISSSATSGAERHVLDVSIALRQKGHTVEIVLPHLGWISQEAEKSGLKVHLSPMKGKGWFTTWSRLNQIVRQGQFDLIHAHLTRAAYIGFASSLVCRVPLITSVHIANNDAIYNRLARGRNRLIAVSGYVGGMLHGRGVPDRFIDIVYNGTDFLDFPLADPIEVKRSIGINPQKNLIGIVGRISPAKGQHHIIRALSKVKKSFPDTHLVAVGEFDDGYETEIHSLVARHDLEDSVTFTGLRSDVPQLLDSCLFTVMPSELETFGLAAVESMARSRPVVASAVGALPEVVRHGQSGLLADPARPEFEDAVTYLLEEDRIRGEMGACARQIVEERFSNPIMTGHIEDVYMKALFGQDPIVKA